MAVGVSGGGDSMALAALLHENHDGAADYLIVNHQFRPESAKEAATAAASLRKLGVAASRIHTLTPAAIPAKKTQETARAMRFAAFGEWCRLNAVFDLLLAHHLEDQAETLLTRLSRGSGLQGLAAMRPLSYSRHFRLIRPLLGVSKRRLAATAAKLRIPLVNDPSNRSSKYLRVRLRQALEAEGATPERLAATAAHLNRAAEAVNDQVATLGGNCLKLLPEKYAALDKTPFAKAPQEVGLRLLARILTHIGDSKARFEPLLRLYGLLVADKPFPPQTLNHCRIVGKTTLDRREIIIRRQ